MKTTQFLVVIAAFSWSINSFGQNAATQKTEAAKEISFATQAEKDEAVLKLENRIKVDMSDKTFPADLLEKEKQELSKTKKAKIVALKK